MVGAPSVGRPVGGGPAAKSEGAGASAGGVVNVAPGCALPAVALLDEALPAELLAAALSIELLGALAMVEDAASTLAEGGADAIPVELGFTK